jgi:uncharacterized surface protein with fasciclin (FAS1) repeats
MRRSLARPWFILALTLAGTGLAPAATVFYEAGGLLVIEAEHYHGKANTSVRDWYTFPTTSPTPTPDPDGAHPEDTGNGEYVEILPDTRVTHEDVLENGVNFFQTGLNAPRLEYAVHIITPGRYYARIRAYSTGTEDNSVHIGVDDTWPLSGTAVQWCDGKNQWTWSGARRVPEDHCGITNGIYLDLTAGAHTLMIGMREDGFEMDRFLLTTDPDFFPTGIGPAESPNSPVIPPPPQITTQPEPFVNAYVGDTVTLSVVVTGAQPMAYQWTKDGADLEEKTDPMLTLTDAQVSDSGTYTVRVSNSSGSIVSGDSVVSITIPPPSLWEIVSSSSELSTLEAAVEAAGFVETLQGEDPLTLFAPNNAAFEALPEGALEDLLADPEQLLALLTYHTLAETQTSADLEPGNYATLQGSTVAVTTSAETLRINDSTVILPDTTALNGVLHVIDTVLQVPVPPQIVTPPEPEITVFVGDTVTLSVEVTGDEPLAYQWTKDGADLEDATNPVLTLADAQVSDSGTYAVRVSNPGGSITSNDAVVTVRVLTLWNIVEATAELSTLQAAIEAAGLVETLQGEDPLTLFAPDNAAFEALPEGALEDLLADPEQLLALLTYHALAGIQTSADLEPGNYVTLHGSIVTVTTSEGTLRVNDSTVILPDTTAINGALHVIDTVLRVPVPPQIVTPPEPEIRVFVGDTVTLSVEAIGDEPLYYQWTKDASDLAGANGPTLTLTDARISDSGTYAVRLSNAVGALTSADAVLTVLVPTLWDLIETSEELSTLEAAVEAAGLVETLQGEDPLTLFAPNNAAFEALPEGALEDLLADPEQLLALLTYHALAGTQTSADLEPGNYVTLQGSTVAVTTSEETLRVNDSTVILPDTTALNGVLHVIDTVLRVPVPPQIVTPPEPEITVFVGDTVTLSVEVTGDEPLAYQWTKDGADLEAATNPVLTLADAQVSDSGTYAVRVSNPGGAITSNDAVVTILVPTLWDLIETSEELSTLEAAVEAAGLVETLQGEDPLTLFAPNNAAFEALPEGALEDLLADPEQLVALLTYHALAGTQTSADLEPGNYVTLQGSTVAVTTSEETLRVNDSTVILPDATALNGVLHVIDTVLQVPVPPQIVTPPEPEISVFVGDTVTLSVEVTGDEPLAYQWTKDGADLEEATNPVLTLANAQVSYSGTYAVRVSNPGGAITSSDAVVTILVPTLWDLIETSEELSTLEAAVEAAGLVETLQGEDPLTLFAPNNAAFEALPEGALEDLLADPEQLVALLTYHALAGTQTSADLEPGNYVTLQGSTVAVTTSEETLRVNDSTVILPDTTALNGVLHVIDTVLRVPVPPQIVTPPEPEISVFVGDTVTLSVEVTGDEPLAYQWTKDGADLEAATNPVLTLADAQVSDSGTYAVRVSNPGGSITSSDATVTVIFLPPIMGQPTVVDGNITITWTGGGEIETATDINGPWTPSGNTSGSFMEPLDSGNKFFRIKISQ